MWKAQKVKTEAREPRLPAGYVCAAFMKRSRVQMTNNAEESIEQQDRNPQCQQAGLKNHALSLQPGRVSCEL